MAAGIRVTGLRETVKSLEGLGVEVADLKTVFNRVGNLVVNEAKVIAPVRSGRLVGSIKASKTKNKAVVRAGGAHIPYAGVIHYGWPGHGIEPHPFLTSALEHQETAAVREMETGLRGLIRKYGLDT